MAVLPSNARRSSRIRLNRTKSDQIKVHKLRRGLGLNALFGDLHVNFEHDAQYFDTVNIWYGTENGQTPNGGIEGEVTEFRWLMSALKP
jgi:hypothetical protein